MDKLIVYKFSQDFGDQFIFESCGEVCIYDTYYKGNSLTPVKNLLNGRKAVLVLTHIHIDHVGNAKNMINANLIKELYVSKQSPVDELRSEKTMLKEIVNLCKSKGIPVHYVGKGDTFYVGATKHDVLVARSSGGNNARSLITLVEIGGCKVLMTGDAETSTFNELFNSGYDLSNITIMKIPHHGVKENNPQSIFTKIAPTIAICNCCGENKNTYKSWAKEAYNRAENAKINCYSVMYNGDMEFMFDQGVCIPIKLERNYQTVTNNGISRLVNKKAKIYWHKNFVKDFSKISSGHLAAEVLLGRLGSGNIRKMILGKKYEEVQKLVNEYVNDRDELIRQLTDYVLSGEAGRATFRKIILQDYYQEVQDKINYVVKVANEIISGNNPYGDNDMRKENLGKDYQIIQNQINRQLK